MPFHPPRPRRYTVTDPMAGGVRKDPRGGWLHLGEVTGWLRERADLEATVSAEKALRSAADALEAMPAAGKGAAAFVVGRIDEAREVHFYSSESGAREAARAESVTSGCAVGVSVLKHAEAAPVAAVYVGGRAYEASEDP